MRSIFDLFDTNHDGTICVSELMKLMQSCGQNPTEGDVVEIMKAVDKNGESLLGQSLWKNSFFSILLIHAYATKCVNDNKSELNKNVHAVFFFFFFVTIQNF